MPSTLKVQDALNYLNRFAPPNLAEDWDNVGLQVGNLQDPLTGILVSLDVTEAVLWEAVEHGANLIITHHPLFFRSISRLDDEQVPTRLARLATQMAVNILSFHTNLDATTNGLNDQLAKTLKLTQTKPLIVSKDPKQSKSGLGRIGKIKKTKLKSFLAQISKTLKLSNLCFAGDLNHPISKVAVMTGSGGGFFEEARSAGADVLVTGDVKYHQALDAKAQGIALVDIGHFAGEIGMVSLISKKLTSYFKTKKLKIKVWETQMQSNPIEFFSNNR